MLWLTITFGTLRFLALHERCCVMKKAVIECIGHGCDHSATTSLISVLKLKSCLSSLSYTADDDS